MGVTEYIGARYVPIYMGYWREDAAYEALDVVMYQGNSYVARKPVPAGVGVDDAEYWIQSGNYDAQTEAYRRETRQVKQQLDAIKAAADRETEQRMNADEVLGERITANGVSIEALQQRVTTERGEVDTAIQAEATARQDDMTAVQGDVTELQNGVSGINTRLNNGIKCGYFAKTVELDGTWQPLIDEIIAVLPEFDQTTEPIFIVSGLVLERTVSAPVQQSVWPIMLNAETGESGRYDHVRVTIFSDSGNPTYPFSRAMFTWLYVNKEELNV